MACALASAGGYQTVGGGERAGGERDKPTACRVEGGTVHDYPDFVQRLASARTEPASQPASLACFVVCARYCNVRSAVHSITQNACTYSSLYATPLIPHIKKCSVALARFRSDLLHGAVEPMRRAQAVRAMAPTGNGQRHAHRRYAKTPESAERAMLRGNACRYRHMCRQCVGTARRFFCHSLGSNQHLPCGAMRVNKTDTHVIFSKGSQFVVAGV